MSANTDPSLTIKLLGPFSAQLNDTPLHPLRKQGQSRSKPVSKGGEEGTSPPPLRKQGQWLLALLVLQHDREVSREWLADRLCPDTDNKPGHFRVILKNLRDALNSGADCLLQPTPRTLRLDLTAVKVDVLDFLAAIKRGDMPSLEQAVALYRGPLLEGCDEFWVIPDRAEFQQHYLTALGNLADYAVAGGNYDTATHYLRMAIEVDPARETAQRALMRVLKKSSNFEAEVQVYRDLCAYLNDELDRSPELETKDLHHQIQEEARRQVKKSSIIPRRDPASPVADNIPVPLTSLVGRRNEVHQIKADLLSARLVTLTGAGGVGKTRLAIQVADEVKDDYPDGVWFVELADLNDPTLVTLAVAAVLGVQEQPARPLEETLAQALKSKAMLLVLDNCEHLRSACASLITRLLKHDRHLRLFTTSRQSLGLLGEVVRCVPSLSLPDQKPLFSEDKDLVSILHDYEAIQLFVQRAQDVRRDFHLSPQNARLVAQICHRLDGIPFAIELAAARIRTLSVADIVVRLDDRFRLLTGGSRTAPQHQQTMLATIDWSYDLTSDAEKALLHRLSVFAGGWTLEAAESVCATANKDGSLFSVLDLLTSLVDQSLVVHEEREGKSRYHLLETVRQYAAGRLGASGENEAVRTRHRDYFLALAEEAEPKLWGAEQEEWLERLEVEHTNLWVALEGEADHASLRLAGSLWRFWYLRGHITEGHTRLIGLLNTAQEQGDRIGRARVLMGIGSLAHVRGDNGSARIYLEQSIALYRELAEKSRLADALNNLVLVASGQQEFAEALRLHQESLTIQVELENKPGVASSSMNLGCLAFEQGDYEAARTRFEDCLILFQDFGDQVTVSGLLMNLGVIAQKFEDHKASLKFHNASLEIKRKLGDKLGIANSLLNMGDLAYSAKDYVSALSLCKESLALYSELDVIPGVVK